jgi:hypothetical protein
LSRWSMCRWPVAALAVAAPGAAAFVAEAAPAGASSVSVKVSPDRGLVNGQVVTISGHGLVRSYDGSPQTWFATECTAAVHGHMTPATDTSHCDITDAKAVRVARNGNFSTRFRVRTGIIGDGYCGSNGHVTCVIGVGTADGLGTVVKINFNPGSTKG